MTRCGKWRCAALPVLAVLGMAHPEAAWSADENEPKETYAERFTYDPTQRNWEAEVPPEPGTEEGDLELAKRALARQRPKRARRMLKKWLKTYGTDAPHYAEARLALADADLQVANYMKAHEGYKALIDGYPGSTATDRAMERDFVVAECFLAGKKRKFLGMRLFGATEEALEMLEDVVANNPGSEIAEQAIRTRASYFYRTGDFGSAALEFDRLAREFPRSRFAPMATLRSGEASLASFPGVKFDASSLAEAREKFVQFRQVHPRFAEQQQVDLYLDQIDNSLAEKAYVVAEYYEKVQQPSAAAIYYESVVRRWPDTTWGARARNRLDVMGYLSGTAPEGTALEPAPTDAKPTDSQPGETP